MNDFDSPYLDDDVKPLVANEDEDFSAIPDPNIGENMVGEVLPNDWTSDDGN